MTTKTAAIATLLAFCLSATLVRADEGCVDFKWDVTRERSLFTATATSLTAGKDANSAPPIMVDQLYDLKLIPQAQVSFAAAPGKKAPTPGSNAGIVTFKLPASGSYRVAIDMPFWIDIVSNGALVAAKDFQGQHGCNPPHKIVEFDLAGARPFFLQLSNSSADRVRVTLTATPDRKL